MSKKSSTFAANLRLMLILLFFLLFQINALPAQAQRDWAGFNVYADSNNALKTKQEKVSVVFYGNSITQIWYEIRP